MATFEYGGDEWLQDVWRESTLADQVEKTGEEILAAAKANASIFSSSGDFEKSITGSLKHSKKGRPYYRVESNDPGALSIEFGTAHQPAKRALGKAIEVYKGG